MDLDCSRGEPGLGVGLAKAGQHNILSHLNIQRLSTTAQALNAQTTLFTGLGGCAGTEPTLDRQPNVCVCHI